MRRVEAIWFRETLSPLLNNLHLELNHCQQLKEEYRLLLSLTVAFEHLPLNNPDKVNAFSSGARISLRHYTTTTALRTRSKCVAADVPFVSTSFVTYRACVN